MGLITLIIRVPYFIFEENWTKINYTIKTFRKKDLIQLVIGMTGMYFFNVLFLFKVLSQQFKNIFIKNWFDI